MQGPPVLPGQSPDQNQLAAMMWQMQMASPHQNPAMMMPPPAMMMPPWQAPILNVRVEGLTFEYQLTDDDVRKVFSRYGEVFHVTVDKEGTSATVQFDQPHHAMAAQHDLDRKQLAGMQGAYLRVDYPNAMLENPFAQAAQAAQMAAASAAQSYSPPNPMVGGYPSMPGNMQGAPGSPSSAQGRPKKYTCKLEVGIENEGEFRVGSRVIQIARQIWQDPRFQEYGGKTRLRGKGVGGPHEADEPLALCISCKDQASFEKAMTYAESQLQKVHAEYKEFCQQKGLPSPELQVKVSKKGGFAGPSSAPPPPGVDPPRGERPSNAPTDEEIERFIEERNEARKASNFKKSDEIRDYLRQRGVVLMDDKGAKGNLQGKEVTKWRFWRP
mmetsp:Transcript_151307/g.275312  ORF Transcript_151307/g.275312 Transcript_151307/m.275312 type:complete len:384 (-) Transcript_151307:225-1376(-)